jgi:hypothetical protein
VCIKIPPVGFVNTVNKRKITKYEMSASRINSGAFLLLLALLLHIVQTGSGVHPTSYKMCTGGRAAGA